MAKRTSARASAQALVRKPPEVLIADDVKLDLTIGVNDLTDMVRSDARDFLMQKRAEVLGQLNRAKDSYNDTEKRINTLAETLAKNQATDRVAADVVVAISQFLAVPYGVLVEAESCNLETRIVKAKVSILPQQQINAGEKRGYYEHDIASKTVTLPFDSVMAGEADRLSKDAEQIRQVQSTLDQINRQVADLPNLVDRAKSKLMKAYLRNELGTGSDLLAVLAAVQPVTLPSLPHYQ